MLRERKNAMGSCGFRLGIWEPLTEVKVWVDALHCAQNIGKIILKRNGPCLICLKQPVGLTSTLPQIFKPERSLNIGYKK